MLIPEAAVTYGADRTPFVEVVAPEEPTGRRRVPIKVGVGNGTKIQVLGGVKPGDLVVIVQPGNDLYFPLAGREATVLKVYGADPFAVKVMLNLPLRIDLSSAVSSIECRAWRSPPASSSRDACMIASRE